VRYWNNELIVKTFLSIHWEMNRRINGVHEERRERRRLNYIYHSSSSLLPTLFLLFFSYFISTLKSIVSYVCVITAVILFAISPNSWAWINLPPPLLKCLHTKKKCQPTFSQQLYVNEISCVTAPNTGNNNDSIFYE